MTPHAPDASAAPAAPGVKGPEAFRTISEASTELGVPSHVLRFWETRFSFIRPMKRAGGRRFYRPRDLEVLKGVRALLHEEGYTIKGVQRLHKEQGVRRLVAAGGADASLVEEDAAMAEDTPPRPSRRLRLSIAAVEPEPRALAAEATGASEPVVPLLSPGARQRLTEVLDDLEAAKSAIDGLLDTPEGEVRKAARSAALKAD